MSSTLANFGCVYDLGIIIGKPGSDPLPLPIPGVFIVRVPDQLSLDHIADSPIGMKLMHGQNWYREYEFIKVAVAPGIYKLRLPVPYTTHKKFSDQIKSLSTNEQVAPAALVAGTMLLHRWHSQPDSLNKGWSRCLERVGGASVGLAMDRGQLRVSDVNEEHDGAWVWLAGYKRFD